MKDLQGVENAKLIQIGEEICDMISEYIERPWYEFTPEEEGVYRLEYSKETIDTVLVYAKPRFFFQTSRLVDKTRDLQDKKCYLIKNIVQDYHLHQINFSESYNLE